MTAQFLQQELTTLVQEAKRKNSDLRHATEKSLSELKTIGPATDVAVELSRKPGFLTPFLIACGTRNAKFSTIGVGCLQRLIVSEALAKSRLKEVLEAFREAANLGVDIQLKILQALPPLFKNYADELHGPLLGEALFICSILQGSKMGVVNNTAAATLSQIVSSIFEKVVTEDAKALEVPTVGEAPSTEGKVPLRPAALDAYRVFFDLCILTEGQKPQFLRFSSLPQAFALELIESVITNYANVFLAHPEQAYILQTRVAPLILRALSERLSFPITVRIVRVLYMLLRKHLSIISAECEIALSLLTHMLEPDGSQPWKRALCMEVFRGLCLEPALIRSIYAEYDGKEGKKQIMKELMGAMTRLSTEKPTVIGMGTQSSAPAGQQAQKDASSEQAALEAGGVAGIIGGAVGLGDAPIIGISSQWSNVRLPYIDHLDKTDPPPMPESYIYYLTLTCITYFCDGLAKFALPLATPDLPRRHTTRLASDLSMANSDGESIRVDTRTPSPARSTPKKRNSVRPSRVPIDPSTLESHPHYADIKTSAAMIDTCWPAVLAACSTFFYATLDQDLYRALVRAFQRFTQVAGVFRLNTPRDAFLTTLGKAAVPSNVLSANISASPMTPSGDHSSLKLDRTSSATEIQSGQSLPSLNSRNLLCLRALLNLGITLGPTLDSAWAIILETLQQADYVLFASSRRSGRQLSLNGSSIRTETFTSSDNSNLMNNIGPELSAVEQVAGKMFESTRDFPDQAFTSMISALCKLLAIGIDQPKPQPHTLSPSPRSPLPHKRLPSVSSISIASQVIGDHAFTLAKMGELAQINMTRLIGPNPDNTGWNILMNHLVSVAGSREMGNSIRIKAAEVLNEIAVSAAKSVTEESTENVAEVQRRILAALNAGVEDGNLPGTTDTATKATELEIHRAGLEALNAILEHAGQSLVSGWEIIFDIITSVFDASMVWRRESIAIGMQPTPHIDQPRSSKSPRLIRSSFSSLELICSDFLASLPTNCFLVLVDALFAFCAQKDDLNISLTTVTFFWNVSAFLQSKGEASSRQGEQLTAEAESEQDLLDIVVRTDVDSHSALWMLLLLRLTGVSKDVRAEVRNGSIQTLFRIFDTYGHQLGPQGWSSCLKIVVFKMMMINPKDLAIVSDSKLSERKQWDDTIKLILEGIGTLYSNYLGVFSQQSEFRNTWTKFMQYLQSLLSRQSFEVSTTVFQVIANVLRKVQKPEDLVSDSRQEVWDLWSSQGVKVVDGNVETSRTGIQETLTAYVEAFKPLYRILNSTLTVDIVTKALKVLRECLLYPDTPNYFIDVDILTPLQSVILDAVKLIRTDIPQVPSILLKQISEFATIAYSSELQATNKGKRPSYIALSTQTMKLLEQVTLKHVEDTEIYYSGALEAVLDALCIPITLKYDFTPALSGAKRPSQWILATKVVLSLLKRALPAMDKLSVKEASQKQLWQRVVKIVSSIIRADSTASVDEKTLRQDEEFDIEKFKELRALIIPSLGRNIVPDEVIKNYVSSVFSGSLLYEVPGLLNGLEEEWYGKSPQGSTSELVLERRNHMSYVCLDELFKLATVSDEDSGELKRLADVAVPFLVRRVEAVLKNYVADQPLRGRMPQPVSQRKEMLYILQRVVDLESKNGAVMVELPHIPKSSKRHLFTLLPLFSRCIAVAHGDQELLVLLSRALDEMGEALGLGDVR